jgi:hypothetical protein
LYLIASGVWRAFITNLPNISACIIYFVNTLPMMMCILEVFPWNRVHLIKKKSFSHGIRFEKGNLDATVIAQKFHYCAPRCHCGCKNLSTYAREEREGSGHCNSSICCPNRLRVRKVMNSCGSKWPVLLHVFILHLNFVPLLGYLYEYLHDREL